MAVAGYGGVGQSKTVFFVKLGNLYVFDATVINEGSQHQGKSGPAIEGPSKKILFTLYVHEGMKMLHLKPDDYLQIVARKNILEAEGPWFENFLYFGQTGEYVEGYKVGSSSSNNAMCVGIPMGKSGSKSLCAAHSVSITMRRKLVSSRNLIR
ncbi:hypothetical protein L1987_23410 [Smallanthus sonchifolius]|uniref:Uncharacterized protein n=1 Tax=Smallanthus sonchifolius TaxID=185202 RepID=A0ACB9IHL0_9ASTR|nr:hypothetical protein L1987_23410 [Smallanthus sonchifolius]